MFKHRSRQKELLDEEDIPKELLYKNLQELELVNNWLGGIKISLDGFEDAIDKDERVVLADIGCGGGDTLKAFAKKSREEGWNAHFVGIDLKQDCIDYAERTCRDYNEIRFICDDYKKVISADKTITHIHAALFCHHLTDDEIVELLGFCKEHNKTLIINDLERHPFAYHSIKVITRLFNGSELVKNDAPLSVLRGFKKTEWKELLHRADVEHYHIEWKWAFRHLIIIPHAKN